MKPPFAQPCPYSPVKIGPYVGVGCGSWQVTTSEHLIAGFSKVELLGGCHHRGEKHGFFTGKMKQPPGDVG